MIDIGEFIMFNQFDQDEFDRKFAEAEAKFEQAQKEAEARKLQFDKEWAEAEERINARIAAQRKMHDDDECESVHVHHSGSCYNNAHRAHQQFVDEVNRQQFADFVNSMNF